MLLLSHTLFGVIVMSDVQSETAKALQEALDRRDNGGASGK